MGTRYFALIVGIVYVLLGILGFIPGITQSPGLNSALTVNMAYGFLFTLFAVNVILNLLHVVVGLVGIGSYTSWSMARNYSRGLAILMAVVAIFGFIPVLDVFFGLIPFFGNEIWLHAITAVVAAYFGWVGQENVDRTVGASR